MKTIKLINNNESEKKMKNMRYEGFKISHNKKLLKTEKEKKKRIRICTYNVYFFTQKLGKQIYIN